jgi:hypothetical protein
MNNQKFNELLFESEKSFSKLTKKSYKFNKTKEESKLNLEELGTPIKNNTNQNYQVYKNIIEKFPFVKDIMATFYVNEKYAINDIWLDWQADRIVFYFNQSCAFYSKPETLNLFKKYEIFFQVPGNTDYNFSISINV